MFPRRYYTAGMFAPRYFVEANPVSAVGGTATFTIAAASAGIVITPASVGIARTAAAVSIVLEVI